MNKNRLSLNAVEDWYGCCAEGLCKAALIYNPGKDVKFSTLAYVCMHNEMRKVLAKQSKEETCLSLEYNVTEDIRLIDCVHSPRDEFSEVEFYEIFNRQYNKLSNRNKQIIDDYIHKECTLAEVGKPYGIGRATVSKIYVQFLNGIYSELYENKKVSMNRYKQ